MAQQSGHRMHFLGIREVCWSNCYITQKFHQSQPRTTQQQMSQGAVVTHHLHHSKCSRGSSIIVRQILKKTDCLICMYCPSRDDAYQVSDVTVLLHHRGDCNSAFCGQAIVREIQTGDFSV